MRLKLARASQAALSCALLLLCASCRTPGQQQPVTVSPDTKLAPEFVLQDVSGKQVRLSDLAGQVRLIDFWATWCAPCKEEIPMFKELYQSYRERGFTILAISDESADLVRAYVEKEAIPYPNLIGTEQVVSDYQVLALPTAYLLDRDGRIVESFMGPKPRKVLEPMILKLLESSQAS